MHYQDGLNFCTPRNSHVRSLLPLLLDNACHFFPSLSLPPPLSPPSKHEPAATPVLHPWNVDVFTKLFKLRWLQQLDRTPQLFFTTSDFDNENRSVSYPKALTARSTFKQILVALAKKQTWKKEEKKKEEEALFKQKIKLKASRHTCARKAPSL